jgi:hypothetical protein
MGKDPKNAGVEENPDEEAMTCDARGAPKRYDTSSPLTPPSLAEYLEEELEWLNT